MQNNQDHGDIAVRLSRGPVLRPRGRRPHLLATALPLLACGLLVGCASQVRRQDAAGFQSQLNAGDYAGAARTAMQSGQITPDGKTRNVVWGLNAGAATLAAEQPAQTVALLDHAEGLMHDNDVDYTKQIVDYHYASYDRVMLNLYKGLAYLKQGQTADADTEFRRAVDDERRAKEAFAKETAATQRKLASSPANNLPELVGKAEQSKPFQDNHEAVSRMAAAYAPFENPVAYYINGIFLLGRHDQTPSNVEEALQSLAEVRGVVGANPTIDADIALGQQMQAGGPRMPQTWVVFENGQSPTFQEMRIVLPMVTGHPMTLAMPQLTANPAAASRVTVQAGGAIGVTNSVGSFDAVMASEFQKRMPLILTNAVVEVVLKNGLSVAAQQSNSLVFSLVSDVAANVSTADTRSWTALPKEFQAVRVATPANGMVSITTAEGQVLGTATVPADRSSIVYVKLQAPGARPSVQAIPL